MLCILFVYHDVKLTKIKPHVYCIFRTTKPSNVNPNIILVFIKRHFYAVCKHFLFFLYIACILRKRSKTYLKKLKEDIPIMEYPLFVYHFMLSYAFLRASLSLSSFALSIIIRSSSLVSLE